MKLKYLQRPEYEPIKKIPRSKEHPRHWVFTEDVEIRLSDGRLIVIEEGFIFDGASIPRWLWWLFKPIDEAFIGDAIHDYLWINKKVELEHFRYNINDARRFADDERLRWRRHLAPNKKLKNNITHAVIRVIGGLFYSKQLEIPS